jgi:hypothetical protein
MTPTDGEGGRATDGDAVGELATVGFAIGLEDGVAAAEQPTSATDRTRNHEALRIASLDTPTSEGLGRRPVRRS